MKELRFIVTMKVLDDDQTDPHEVRQILSDILNDNGSAMADWRVGINMMVPEARPIISVRVDYEYGESK